jgi:neutral ceramidase
MTLKRINRTRRRFLKQVGGGLSGAVLCGSARPSPSSAAPTGPAGFSAGEGVVDITPPLGIEMGGFHRPPGQERRIREVRQPCAVRALVLAQGDTRAAVCSLDVAAVGDAMASRIRAEVSRRTGIPADNVRICATHTHSMPAFCFLRQWGAVPVEFMAAVEQRTVEAVRLALADLAPAELSLGKCRVEGGNHNRTARTFKTDAAFGASSTDAERWLDTTLHALLFSRTGGKRTLLWYHFSAHAVCFADEAAGPDWPGTVARKIRETEKLDASFLSGHCGDVNPGDGRDWRGEIHQTTAAIRPALQKAIHAVKPVKVDRLRTVRESFRVPFDMELFRRWLTAYREKPAQCTGSEWVDAGFAADWYRGNATRRSSETHLPITTSALALGPVGFYFHPAELYSYYGLAIRRGSPFADTLSVGYTDGIIGYLTDPNAYKAGEYAAMVVPKILDYPPFTPDAASRLTDSAGVLLRRVGG